MKYNSLVKFKSGADIRAVATSSNNDKAELSVDVVKEICISFAIWIKKLKNIPIENQLIAVGSDNRLSSPKIKNTIINNLSSVGVFVYDCLLTSTPAISLSTSLLSCSAAIQITASHLPKQFNGLKFFIDDRHLNSEELDEIMRICEENINLSFVNSKNVQKIDLMEKYCEFLVQKILKTHGKNKKKPLKNLKIMVDAGSGVGGFFAEKVLNKLGADVSSSVLLKPDGNFSFHMANPEDEEAINYAKKITIESGADLGIVFDTDVDRCGFIGKNGELYLKNSLIALCCAISLEINPKSIIVTDSVTSYHLEEFIKSLGGSQFRFKRGYSNVILKAKEICKSGLDCVLAIESSGHAAFKEHNFIDDGAYLALKIVFKLSELKERNMELLDLIKKFKNSKESKEFRFAGNSKIIEKLKNNYNKIKYCEIDNNNFEGLRLKFKDKRMVGWCLLRQSIHSSSLVLNIESDVSGGVELIYKSIKNLYL